MRNMYTATLRFLLVTLALFGAASCIRPETDGCVDPRGNVRLTVGLGVDVAARNNTDIPYSIGDATIYVFDADNKYVTSFEGAQYTGEPYEFFLTLEGGDYDFVVWTNLGECYKVSRTTDYCETNRPEMVELEFGYDHSAHDCRGGLIPDLLYGARMHETIAGNSNNHISVLMSPDTYIINIKAKGLPQCEDDFDFSITDNNSHYTFDNSIIDGKDDFKHIKTCRQERGELNATIKTLRLTEGRHPQLVFSNATTGEALFGKSLVRTITDAYAAAGMTVDFGTTFRYDIVLTYSQDMSVTVSVNGWEYDEQGGLLE